MKSQSDLRILLIEPDDYLRNLRAGKLLKLGYRVVALRDSDGAPPQVPPQLYDAIVITIDPASAVSLDWCRRVSRPGVGPLVALVAHSPFIIDAAFVPSVVLSGTTEQLIQDRLSAFLESALPRREVQHV